MEATTHENNFSEKQSASLQGEKQHLILHVGPPKTGTTTLQNSLYQIKEKLLNMDNYYYLARSEDAKSMENKWMYWVSNEIGHEFRTYLRDIGESEGDFLVKDDFEVYLNKGQAIDYDKKWRQMSYIDTKKRHKKKENRKGDFKEKVKDLLAENKYKSLDHYHDLFSNLNKLREDHQSVIISAEQFCFNNKLLPDNARLWNLFAPPLLENWEVIVVVTYRRYYEWITSFYYQENLQRFFPNRKETMESFIMNILEQSRSLKKDGKWLHVHPTFHAYTKYKNHFDHVKIINLHDVKQGDIATNFICNAVPNADHTCSYMKSSTFKSPILRKSTGLDFHLLVQIAFDRKYIQMHLFDSNLIYDQAVKATKRFHEESFEDEFSYKCLPSDITDEILEMSQAFEKELLPDWYQIDENRKSLHDGFQNVLKEQRFCEPDYEEILSKSEWRNFFSSDLNRYMVEDALME